MMEDTDTDWRGTPLRKGATVVWVVRNSRSVEGTVISWDDVYVVVRPRRQAHRVQGGVAESEERLYQGQQTVERMKVTVVDG